MSQSTAPILQDPLGWINSAVPQSESPLRLKGVPLTARIILSICARIEIGAMGIVLPDGRSLVFRGKEPGPQGVILLHDYRALSRLASGGSLGLAESYLDGEWDSPDLTAVLEAGVLNGRRFSDFFKVSPLKRAFDRIIHALRPNTRAGARRNIHAHYDLGNTFYERWLDPTMTYSSALYLKPTDTLWAAQFNKYKALCETLDLKDGQTVLEIGCGWGGFAEYATGFADVHVTGLTISREQLDWSIRRMEMNQVDDKVDILFQDYRDATGTYDRIASIEMFEAVGEEYWPDYFRTIRERLKADGKAALQIITIDDQFFDRYRKRVDFIQQHIFPGGMLISEPRLAQEVERAGLKITSIRRFGLDYARTLAEWARTFEMNWGELRRQGFDEEFRRLWRFYLAYCEAGFRTGRTNVIQVALEPA